MKKVKRKRIGRRILSFVLSLVLTLGLLPEMPGVKLVVQAAEGITITIDTGASVTIKDADGDGYYDIGTADELYAFAAAVNSGNREIYGELTADIVVNESLEEETRKWMPIGNATYPFKGKFDGNGHTISGLYFKDARVDYVGLFGYVQSWSAAQLELRNIGIINSMFWGKDYVGAICGKIDNGLIHNCYNTGEVLGRYYVGGICGYSINSAYGSIDEIKYCYNAGSFGGVSGYDDAYIYKNCYYIGNSETDNISGTEYKTEANFKSGEVCWLLNNSTASDTSAWGQNIGIDSLPILGGPVVYSHTFNGKTFYSNGKNAAIKVGDVYEIDSADKLRWFVDAVNSGWNNINAKLTADIDLTGRAWNCMETYAGTFDGNGYTIEGMCSNSGMGDGNRYGLIRTLSSGGKVTNLTISKATLWSNKLGTGSIAETNEGVISNCLVKNSTLQYGAGKTLGGIAGTNAGTITNCGIVECSLKRRWGGAGNNTLGYVADVNNGTVSNCYSYGCTLKDASVGFAIVASGNSPTNCYYYTTSTVADTAATPKTKEQFASGAVCYLLNGSKSIGDLVWGQTLGTDNYPVFKTENNLVCKSATEENYSNHNQFNANGFCSTCGAGYEKPEIIGGVYRIENVGQLLWFAEFVNSGNQSANAKLTADINMNGIDWTMMESFAGTFDGAGHTISGLNGHKAYNDNKHGFIRTLVNGGAVKNLTFNEASVFNNQEGSGSISAVIAYTNNGTIENCVVKNSLIQSAQTTLAVVAGENNGTIRNSASISNEVKRRYSSRYEKAASGFVWSNGTNATIESCMVYDCAYVEASANYAFTQSNTGTITNCYYYESSENLSHTVGTPVTAEKFASGEVAYLLNGSKTTGTLAWYQNLDESADAYPVLDSAHGTVYKVNKYDCPEDNEAEVLYGNTEGDILAEKHTWVNSVCTICEKECTHDWDNSVCTICEKECTTHVWEDGACSICGETCTHTWENSKCTICGEECTTHTWDNSVCSVCGKECTTHSWVDGACSICKEACTHSWENGKCTECGSYQPAVDSDEDGVFEIGNAYQLCWFAKYVNAGNKTANAELTADIDMTGVTWTTICETGLYYNSYGDDLGYSGTFDGKGHVISNLTVGSSKEGDASVGLFGTVSGTIKNLGMKGFILVDNGYDMRVGAIVGQLIKETGKVSNCYVDEATLNTNNRVAGGIAGCVYEGTVENCYVVNATVDGARYGYVAGDVRADGSNTDRAGFIKNCYTDKDALTSSYYVEENLSDNRINVREETFKSGEIAYLLNESTSGGTTWYQTLSGNSADTYPVLNSTSGKVYCGYDKCKVVYANDNTGLSAESEKHSWTDGTCTVCEKECSHSWNGDTCTICGFQYVKDITIKLADETAFGEGEYTFDYDTKVHTINTTKEVTISGTTTKETIVVAKNVSANITLAGVTIDVSDTNGACALKIEGDGTGTVTITLADKTTNELKSGLDRAGLEMELESGYENKRHLIITGTGALDATSVNNGAGIGGGYDGAGGSITINGGTITATGGYGGAGIGGGYGGAGGSITINGGTINATGGTGAVGIGGGEDGAGGSITINGGNVKASGSSSVNGTLQNKAGDSLYLHTITLNGITEQTAITAIAADAEYGLEDVKTLDTNMLYVYLPYAAMPYEVDAGGNCYYGKLTGDTEKEGTFYKVSFEKNSDTEMTGTGEEISTVISIAVPSDKEYTGAAIEAVVTDTYNENAQGMVQYEALEGTLTPVVVTMAPAPTPTPEPQVSFAPEPSVEPSSTPEVTDEPSGSSAPSGSSTLVRLSAALPATSGEPAPAPAEIPVTKNMPVNKGTYKASITLDGETIFVTYDIVARTLQASDFTFTAPEGAVYDGNTHQAAVESALEGMGEITIAYYDEAGNPVNGIPVDAGTYTVKISVSEGENCNAAECLTDDSWTFTIEKKAITITAEDKSVCVNCEEPAFTYVVDGLVEDDVLLAEPVMDSNADMVVTGNYAITPSAADAGSNYSISYVPGTLTVTEHLNDVDDFKCDVCGAIVDGVDLRGSNLTLNGNIGLNLFFEIDEEVKAEILADETAIIRFNLPDGSVTEVPAKEGVEDTTAVVGTTLYKYPCELTAKQMTDKVKVQFVTDGNVIAEYEYSIADYAAVIIANAEGKYSAESIALVKAMLNYGAYAQKNFGYNAENLANAQLAENEKSLSSVTVDTFESSKASAMTVDGLGTFAGSSLVLKSETTLKVYFEPAAGVEPEDLTFTVDGEAVTAETSGKYLVISITDIKAQELDKVFEVKVSDVNSEGTFNACVFAYCYSVLSDTTGRFSEELKDVVKALYLYNVAADAYFN